MDKNYTSVTTADEVTEEILDQAESVFDGWFAGDNRIDWEDFIDRLDGSPLADESTLDLGDDLRSPAISKIKRHITRYRNL